MPNLPHVHAAGLPNEPAQAGMHGNETMTTGNPLEQYELTPEGRSRIGWLVAALALVLAIGSGVWGVTAQRRADTAEQALAAVAAERDAAAAAAEQGRQLMAQVEGTAKAGEARVGELEQQVQALDSLLQGANADVTRLRSELAAREAAIVATPAPPPAPEAAQQAPVSPGSPPVAAVEPAAAPPESTPPVPKPESLAITFEVNSSYLPASLDGRLRELAEGLEADRSYEVELVGSVGNDEVAGKSAEEALRYNRWMAERRVSRVAEFLQKNAKSGTLTIKQDFALNDPSRRVLVEVRPLSD